MVSWFEVISYVDDPCGFMALGEFFDETIVANRNAIAVFGIQADLQGNQLEFGSENLLRK